MFVHQIGIKPCSSGFGQWETDPNSETNDPELAYDLADLLNELDEYYLLGSDELPTDIQDIRGSIQDEPSQVYAVRQSWGLNILGLKKHK